jgi:L-fucose isomerase-like protein
MTLRIGYVGVHIATYYAEEFGQFTRAVNGLTGLAEELDVTLVARGTGVMDATEAAAVAAELRDQHLDFLLIQTAACSMADVVLPFADLGIPLGIWATPEPGVDGDMQLNSFVAASMYVSTLRRYYRDPKPFKWLYGHVEDDAFQRRFKVTVGALKGRAALASSRVAWIGGLAPGFENLRFDQRDLHARAGGARVLPRELRDLVDVARTFRDAEVRQTADEMVAAARAVNIPDESLARNARLYLALREVCARDGTNAVAMQDWPEIQEVYDVSPLLSLCWLAEKDKIPSAHEGDVLGALTMRMLRAVGGGLPTIMDIASVDPERDAALLWHCGGSPHGLADGSGVTYEVHSTLGRKQPHGPWGAVVNQTLAPGECTLAYLSEDVRSLWNVRAEVFADPARAGYDGDRGWIRGFRHSGDALSGADLMDTVLTTGQEHHHGFVHGDVTEELSELAGWMGWREIEPLRYRDAMQRPD